MLKHLFVDNFRTLVNFNIDLEPLTLLLGPNGSGKTTVLDVIRRLRQFTCEESNVDELFPRSTLTRWQDLEVQTFELSLSEGHETYVYHLEILHDLPLVRCRIKSERLAFGNRLLFESKLNRGNLQALLYEDGDGGGSQLLTDGTRSGVGTDVPDKTYRLLTAFKERLGQTQVCGFDPMEMNARSDMESAFLNPNAANYVDWLRHQTAADMEFVGRLRPILGEVLDGYDGLRLGDVGEGAKVLRVLFQAKGSPDASANSYKCSFDELSDGQRLLLMLYSLLAAARQDTTLCLDEPENFLALREVQPWLNALIDKAMAGECQAILVSHHPEMINTLALDHGRWLDRDSGGPTRCRLITQDNTGLPVSELVARGWLNA